MLWRHYDFYNGLFQGRCGRDLVMSFTAYIDYAFYWIFKQSRTIEVRANLTGLAEVQGASFPFVPPVPDRCHIDPRPSPKQCCPPPDPEEEFKYAPLVAPYIRATNHFHSIAFRLDFDVYGQISRRNSAYETKIKFVESPAENPCQNTWVEEETLLKTQKESARDINP